jgi:NAD(P)-dependent dehydrogenase (short-subunit alcohol dehydrogenase family)
MNDTQQQRSALVFGARNLGRAVVEGLRDDGWAVAAVARSESTLATAQAAGAFAMQGDITDPDSIRETLTKTAEAHGAVDLVVNAASAYGGTRSGPFGGGPLAEAAPTAFDDWAAAPGRAAFTFLSAAARFAVMQAHPPRPTTLIQVTGGSARRAMPGRGLWAAGAFAVRAITQAAALELREQGIHVALLIVDAGIEPFEGGGREGVDRAALADPREIADAVAFLADQGARAATHELQVTPLAERWVP